MPVLRDEDFILPASEPPKRRRGNRIDRLSKDPDVDKPAIARAVSYLDEAAAGSRELTDEVRKFASAAHALLTCGLTFNAVVILVQDLMPKQSGGSAHGKPKYSKETIAEVLKSAARLDEHLKPEAKR